MNKTPDSKEDGVLKFDNAKSFYDAIGCSVRADSTVIKKRIKEKMLWAHPDKKYGVSAKEKRKWGARFDRLMQIKQFFEDEDKRKLYTRLVIGRVLPSHGGKHTDFKKLEEILQEVSMYSIKPVTI